MTTQKIQLTEEKATLFITLNAKALDNRSKHSILHDQTATDIIERVDYNFVNYNTFGNKLLVIRAIHFDELVRDFIRVNEKCTVLYLGCGLDSRISRIDLPENVSWYDVDYPEVIRLRNTFYAKKKGYQMIGSSINTPDWLEKIPENHPVIIIAEGVFEYLESDEVKTLLNRLIGHFHHGQVIFDVMNTYAVNSAKKDLKNRTWAVLKWIVDDIREVDGLNRKLKRMAVISLFESPYVKKLPFGLRFPIRIMSFKAQFKNMNRIVQYQF